MKECCIYIMDLTNILDVISRLLRWVKQPIEHELSQKIINRLDICKNLLINIIGRFTAFINSIENIKELNRYDASINTICNLANNIVELRNVIKELLDEPSIASYKDVKNILEKILIEIECIGIKISAMSLSFLGLTANIPINLSSKISSSLASLLFASLLNIHSEDVKNTLKTCYTSSYRVINKLVDS